MSSERKCDMRGERTVEINGNLMSELLDTVCGQAATYSYFQVGYPNVAPGYRCDNHAHPNTSPNVRWERI